MDQSQCSKGFQKILTNLIIINWFNKVWQNLSNPIKLNQLDLKKSSRVDSFDNMFELASFIRFFEGLKFEQAQQNQHWKCRKVVTGPYSLTKLHKRGVVQERDRVWLRSINSKNLQKGFYITLQCLINGEVFIIGGLSWSLEVHLIGGARNKVQNRRLA